MTGPTATLGELCRMVGGTLRAGGEHIEISGVATIEEATPQRITWLSNPKFEPKLRSCRAAAVIAPPSLADVAIPTIITPDPELAVARVLERFRPRIERPARGVHPTAVIAETVQLARNVSIGAFVCVGSDSRIGDGSVLHSHVHVASDCRIGENCELFPHVYVGDGCILENRVVIKPNAVIGSDGFGFIFRDGAGRRLPHTGTVIVEDDVEIGAKLMHRSRKIGATVIGRGTKIDNQVQVAHNCRIGALCILAGQAGLAGSVRLGNGVIMGGRAGSTHGVNICDGARIGLTAIVCRDITSPGDYAGMPARPHMEHNRGLAAARRSEETAAHVREMEQRLARLEAQLAACQASFLPSQ